jgi:hypothetical protein
MKDSKTAADPAVSALPYAWQHRAPTDAEIHAAHADAVLDDLPASGGGCATTDQRLAAAQAHALLSLAARLAELIDAIRGGAEGTRTELEALRCEGIAEVGISGTVGVT